MRPLVQPPPTSHCELCNGELRLKHFEPAEPQCELDTQIWICAQCGHEQTYMVAHHHNAPHTGHKIPPAGAG